MMYFPGSKRAPCRISAAAVGGMFAVGLFAACVLAPALAANDSAISGHQSSVQHVVDTASAGKVKLVAPGIAAGLARKESAGGRILNVVLEKGSSGPYYRVKLLHNGRVQAVLVDARR